MSLLKVTLYHKVVEPVPQLIVVGQLLSCALAFELLAGASKVQLHSSASCLQHIDTPAQTVTISLLTAGVKLPVKKYNVTASTKNIESGAQ